MLQIFFPYEWRKVQGGPLKFTIYSRKCYYLHVYTRNKTLVWQILSELGLRSIVLKVWTPQSAKNRIFWDFANICKFAKHIASKTTLGVMIFEWKYSNKSHMASKNHQNLKIDFKCAASGVFSFVGFCGSLSIKTRTDSESWQNFPFSAVSKRDKEIKYI